MTAPIYHAKPVPERIADKLTGAEIWYRCAYKCVCGKEWARINTEVAVSYCTACRTWRPKAAMCEPLEVWEM
jgi:hypothetical protein